MVQMVKHLPTMWETWVQPLGQEDLWRRKWQPTPVFLPGESPWTEEPGRLQLMGSQRVGHNWVTKPRIKVVTIIWFCSGTWRGLGALPLSLGMLCGYPTTGRGCSCFRGQASGPSLSVSWNKFSGSLELHTSNLTTLRQLWWRGMC